MFRGLEFVLVASQNQLAINLKWWEWMFVGVVTSLTILVVFSFPSRYKQEGLQGYTTGIVFRHWPHPPPIHPLLSPAPSSSSQHGNYVPALAVPLTSTLDQHHGEKTQKEINLAAQAVCSMDSVLELWTWNALSQPLTLNQVFAAHFSSEPAGLLLSTGLVKLTVCATFTTHNAPASCVGIHAFGAAGGLPAIGRDGANGRSQTWLWPRPQHRAPPIVFWLQLLPVNP